MLQSVDQGQPGPRKRSIRQAEAIYGSIRDSRSAATQEWSGVRVAAAEGLHPPVALCTPVASRGSRCANRRRANILSAATARSSHRGTRSSRPRESVQRPRSLGRDPDSSSARPHRKRRPDSVQPRLLACPGLRLHLRERAPRHLRGPRTASGRQRHPARARR